MARSPLSQSAVQIDAKEENEVEENVVEEIYDHDHGSSPPLHDSHDIASLSDLPGRRVKTKLWPMSPIESLTQEEVMAIASRDQTPVMIAVIDGDQSGERYICSNKRGVTLPPDVAAEGSWAKKYYQQVVALSESIKEMQESFQPVWELAKSQQALLVCVEVFDGLLAVANQGLQLLFKTWSREDFKAIVTRECDFRVQKQVHYYGILKNYTHGKFHSLDQERLQSVENLLLAGETYLIHHARTNDFQCPSEVRSLFQEFLPLKKSRNEYSHPLTLAKGKLAFTVLQKLREAVLNDELAFIRGTKDLILLGTDYAESVLQSYGKVRQKLFLDPRKRSSNKRRRQSYYSDRDDDEDDDDGDEDDSLSISSTLPQSPSKHQSPVNSRRPTTSFHIGQSSHASLSPPHPQNPRCSPAWQRPSSLGSPLALIYPHGSEALQDAGEDPLSAQAQGGPSDAEDLEPAFGKRPAGESAGADSQRDTPVLSPSLESFPTSPSSLSQSSESQSSRSLSSPNSPEDSRLRTLKRPRR